LCILLSNVCLASAADPLHKQIDALIIEKAAGQPFSPLADDAEFCRRVYLDFAGRIPTADEARRFFADKAPDKRVKLIDQLLAAPEYATRMQECFNIMFMERLGDHAEWTDYLKKSFEKNSPWDQMAREILMGSTKEAPPGAVYFLAKRLENYGQNPVDYPALTKDIGRLFLGKNFGCSQCHDDLFVDDYDQHDFQGLYAFVKNISKQPGTAPGVAEKLTTDKIEFTSVFGSRKKSTGPRLPGLEEVAIPVFKKGEEYIEAPDKKAKTPGVLKFSTLAKLAEQMPTPENSSFSRNMVNRLWFVLMGRGLVHPLDLSHKSNPPSHPKLLELLATEFVANKYNIKWLLRELALTDAYQRSSNLPPNVKQVEPESFRTAIERRISAEQLLRSVLQASGESAVKGGATFDSQLKLFLAAFAAAQREPEEDVDFSLKGVLFLLNNKSVLAWFDAKPGNLTDRLQKITDDGQAVDELYVSVLTRLPSADEKQELVRYLSERRERRAVALRNASWALFASTEFGVNH